MFSIRRQNRNIDHEKAQQQAALSSRLEHIVKSNDNAPDPRRLKPRKRVCHLALARLTDEWAVSCMVRDITEGGFRLTFAEAVELPDEFDIEIPVLGGAYHVSLRWYVNLSAGVEIT